MIRFENVTKRYRGTAKPALHEIDFEVTRGEFLFLVGASGSGKSSCLRLILREETPSDGRVVVLGRDLRTLASRKVPETTTAVEVASTDLILDQWQD